MPDLVLTDQPHDFPGVQGEVGSAKRLPALSPQPYAVAVRLGQVAGGQHFGVGRAARRPGPAVPRVRPQQPGD